MSQAHISNLTQWTLAITWIVSSWCHPGSNFWSGITMSYSVAEYTTGASGGSHIQSTKIMKWPWTWLLPPAPKFYFAYCKWSSQANDLQPFLHRLLVSSLQAHRRKSCHACLHNHIICKSQLSWAYNCGQQANIYYSNVTWLHFEQHDLIVCQQQFLTWVYTWDYIN